MYSTAMERIRRWYFELFWYTHHLFIIFYAMLLVHGQVRAPVLGLIDDSLFFFHEQSNTLEQAQFWMWFLGPATLYLIERLIRIFRGSVQTVVYQVKITAVVSVDAASESDSALFVCFVSNLFFFSVCFSQAIQHPSNVLEVRLKRTDGKAFRYKSGQYCFLNSPFLAGPEWHPFTITSAPNGEIQMVCSVFSSFSEQSNAS